MMKQLGLILISAMLIGVVPVKGFAQTTIRGHVVNERGETVEYVSIGIENDSVGTISDAKGHFMLTIPEGRRDELTFTHVSYQTAIIPYTTYADGHELTVTLKDKVIELAEVVVGKQFLCAGPLQRWQHLKGKSPFGRILMDEFCNAHLDIYA